MTVTSAAHPDARPLDGAQGGKNQDGKNMVSGYFSTPIALRV
jgi:hypothetical protein